jgi:hypothetical protein
VHDFDQDSFNQLLAEASGSDDQGQPNLGRDVVVNHKLICIVFQIGIESTLEENPFRAATAARKGKSQLRTCLEVLRIAIERSQQVVFVKSDRQGIGAAAKACSLYSWLIPTLLPLVASEQTDEISDAVLALYDAILDADKNCTPHSSSDVVLSFLRHSVSSEFPQCHIYNPLLTVLGILSVAASRPPTRPTDAVIIDGEDFASNIAKLMPSLEVSVRSLKFPSVRLLVLALARVLKLVSKHSESPQRSIQFRKVVSRFRQFVEENEEDAVANGDSPQVCSICQPLPYRTNHATEACS